MVSPRDILLVRISLITLSTDSTLEDFGGHMVADVVQVQRIENSTF